MPLRYLLDENQRGVLRQVIQRHNARGIDLLDVVCVGDIDELPLGVNDPTILNWAEQEQRILITFDKSTMPVYLANHLAEGRHSPGIFMLSRDSRPPEVLEFLVLAAFASDPEEWRDTIRYIP